jgi:hypothetical protein
MSKPLVDRFPFAKTVTILSIAFGIGLGLCGLSAVLPASGEEFHTNWLSLPSLLIIVFSFLGLIFTLIVWVITSAIGGFSGKDSGPQTLFGDSDEDSKDRDQSV